MLWRLALDETVYFLVGDLATLRARAVMMITGTADARRTERSTSRSEFWTVYALRSRAGA
jgi:hypothetical protein